MSVIVFSLPIVNVFGDAAPFYRCALVSQAAKSHLRLQLRILRYWVATKSRVLAQRS
jgi:hypothetical protein